jgi:hypothetical protein
MVRLRKFLIFASISLLIVHIIEFFYYGENLASFILSCTAMMLLAIALILANRKQ